MSRTKLFVSLLVSCLILSGCHLSTASLILNGIQVVCHITDYAFNRQEKTPEAPPDPSVLNAEHAGQEKGMDPQPAPPHQ